MNTFEGYIHMATARAVLFQSHFWGAPLWLPMSQIEINHDYDGMEKVVKVAGWLCRKKQLLEFTPYTEDEVRAMSG